MTTVYVCDLFRRGVVLQPHEAVAIAQLLIHPPAGVIDPFWLNAPQGPPSIDNVQLQEDGTAVAVGCGVRPAVFEIAILLQALLPDGTPHVPGGLRYAIARGLLDVDVPPFDSIEELSHVLNRFERGSRRDAVRSALARLTGERVVLPFGRPRAVPPAVDRRRTPPSATALRRELRESDRLQYERRRIAPIAPATPAIAKRTSRRLPLVAAVLVSAATVAGITDLLRTRASRPGVSMPPTIASAPDVARPAAPIAREPVRPDRIVAPSPLPEVRRVRPEPPAAIARNIETEGRLVPALDRQRRPVFSPAFESNGAAMFFHTGSTHDSRSALAMMPASPLAVDGGDLRVMTIVDDGARNFHVQPSPDGRSIAFDSDRDGDRGVYVANRDGTNVRRISGPGYAAVPTWAPDGRRLAYIRAEPGNPKVWNLWLQSLEDTDARRLTSFRFGQPWSASWFPDNRRICFTHEDKVIVMDLDTGQTREFDSPIQRSIVRTPAVSPDGTKVIFQVFRKGAWILDLADGSMRCVLTDPTAEEFAWAPDGRRVAFHSRRDGQWGIFILYQG